MEFKAFFELSWKLSIFMILHEPQLHINFDEELFSNKINNKTEISIKI